MSLSTGQMVGMMSSASDEWSTPQELFEDLNCEFSFDLDACDISEADRETGVDIAALTTDKE